MSRYGWSAPAGELRLGPLAVRTLGHGRPVVLLHGLGGSNRYWGAAYDRIGIDHQLIVPDLLGFGSSPKPATEYSAQAHVQVLVETLDWLRVGEPAIVGSHSVGCMLALAFAAANPERVAAIVAAGPPLYANRTAARERIGSVSWLARQLAEGRRSAQRVCQFTCSHRRLAVAVGLLGVRRLPREVVRDGVRHTWASYSETFHSLILDVPPHSWIDAVRAPVRLVAGTNDAVIDRSHLAAIANRHAGTSLVEIPDAGHNPPIADPNTMLGQLVTLPAWSAET